MKVTKPIDLVLLDRELANAAVAGVNGLGLSGTQPESGPEQELFTYAPDGVPIELPPAAIPVVDAHTAPPAVIEHAALIQVDKVTRTTDASWVEVFRLPTAPTRLYRGTFQMMAIDAVSGTSKDVEARLSFKQVAGSVAQVGSTVVLSSIDETASSTWAIRGTAVGTDFVIEVRGAAGRTVDWLLRGTVAVFGPEGLEA
jgi:hypothetical protein